MQSAIPLQYLPIYAKVTIERLQADSSLRSAAKLNELFHAYRSTYGTPDTDPRILESVQAIARNAWGIES